MNQNTYRQSNTFLSKLSKKLITNRLFAVVVTLFITTTSSNAYAKLAKTAGLKPATMKQIVKKSGQNREYYRQLSCA